MPKLALHSSSPRQTRSATAAIVTMAALFWLFSYALFTSRVQLRGDEGLAAFLSLRRVTATAAGTLLYAAVLRFLIFPAGRTPAHPLTLVLAVIPAAAAMVAFRAVLDPLVSAEPLPLADHMRWVLVWSGYFGLWLIGFHAWRLYSERARPETAAAVMARTEPSAEWLEELIEAFAREAARLPDADRQVLMQIFDARYPEAEDPLATADRRRTLIRRIATRIAA